ncbi:unnamed protein product [Lota lota]
MTDMLSNDRQTDRETDHQTDRVLGADPDWHVEYPEPFCVVEGSTTTIPCSFTHPVVHKETGVEHRVNRVVWCPDHRICQGNTFSVYDSNVSADSRFLYLGDRVRSCTLQIIKTEKRDTATYRFRFETNADGYTGPPGVRINVTRALGADPDWHVEYPEPFCVVEGSTTTIPCSFTHPVVHKETGVECRVNRVVWCPDNEFCLDTTSYVYDSSNVVADSRFLYLGDRALGADPDWHVEYPKPFCVVEGSTTTIPCSFTHPVVPKGTVVKPVNWVLWCTDYKFCWSTSVYDSSNIVANSRFVYLEDRVGNCTLQIIKTEKRDAGTYRFRFKTNAAGYTGQPGVRITVTSKCYF